MLLQGKAFRKRIKYEFLKAFMRFTLYGDFFIFLLYLFPFFFTFTQIRIIIYLIKTRGRSRGSANASGVFLSCIFSFLFIFFFNTFTPFSVLPCFVKFANQVLDVYAVPVARFFFVQLLAWPGCILHHLLAGDMTVVRDSLFF